MNRTMLLKWVQEGNVSIPTILLTNYKHLKLNEKELVLLLQVHYFLEKGNDFPTPEELASQMTIDMMECHNLLRQLMKHGFIEIIDGNHDSGIRFERYSLEPLWNKLIDLLFLLDKKEEEAVFEKEEKSLYSCFEQEFGRPLSPFEIETLNMWIDDDQHDVALIKAALRESVISGKLNFRYIDRILFEWKKNGIKTTEQAKNQGKKFRQHQGTNTIYKETDDELPKKTVPFYNWLDQ
ncbi:DnaD domain-containing protein [Bacillus sp. B1-b2]|uniref:DnaD domain-containing protein n=1 Tax=Bacillus sp. B1-b2 TaxID=2653201 RepID=UPI0012621FEB|nr:DnaD domain-containing protein [Bacillus sp. B1-b2]KAB7672958.1 DnaD domain-containing protein [Bacillus sp. B1-b2]